MLLSWSPTDYCFDALINKDSTKKLCAYLNKKQLLLHGKDSISRNIGYSIQFLKARLCTRREATSIICFVHPSVYPSILRALVLQHAWLFYPSLNQFVLTKSFFLCKSWQRRTLYTGYILLVERKLWQVSPRRSHPAGLWAATDRENAFFDSTQISPTGQGFR